MPPSAARVAAQYLRTAYANFHNLSDESRALLFGAFIFGLREKVNNRSVFHMNGRPKDVRFKYVDGRVEVRDFPVPEVGWIEYDPDHREVRVLSRSGSVMAKEPVTIRLDYTTAAMKAAGKELATVASILLSKIKRGQPEAGEPVAPKATPARREQPPAPAERVYIRGAEMVEALARVGVKGTSQFNAQYGHDLVYVGDYQVNFGTVEKGGYFWFVSNLMSNDRTSKDGHLPDMPKERALTVIAKGVKEAIEDFRAEAARKKLVEEADSGETWSVAWTGYMLADAGEDEDEDGENEVNGGYVVKVETFGSQDAALDYARSHGPAYVMRGTQMWNEPLGQVEESDRPAKFRLVR